MRYPFGARRGQRRRFPGSGGTPTPTPTPTPSLPAGATMHWDADTVPAQADSTAFSGNWTDKIGGVNIAQATAGNQPLYRTNIFGKAGFTFSGTKSFRVGRPAALLAALGNYAKSLPGCTIVIVCRPSAVTGNFKAVWSPGDANNGSSVIVSGDYLGGRSDRRNVTGQAGKLIVMQIRSNWLSGASNGFCRSNGADSYGTSMAPHASNDYFLGGDGSASSAQHFDGEVMQVMVYPRELTTAEQVNVDKYWHTYYGNQTLPWASAPFIVLAKGDSYTARTTSYFDKWLDSVGHPLGARVNMAVNGWTVTNPTVDEGDMRKTVTRDFSGVAEAYGKPIIIVGNNFYNQPDTAAQNLLLWFSEAKAAAPTAKFVGVTPQDNGELAGSGKRDNRAGASAAVMASSAIDIKVPIHQDSRIGLEGTCPDTPGPYGTDFVDIAGHLTQVGETYKASVMAPYYSQMQALVS